MTEIVVTTGARLHFGLFVQAPGAARQFGGAGAMIDRPGFVIRGQTAASDQLIGEEAWRGRLEDTIGAYRENSPPGMRQHPVRIEIERTIPLHAGLGSGTQFGLAVAKLLSVLAGESDVPAAELARRTGRGKRSAVGLHGFEHGGLIVEGGKADAAAIGRLSARVAIPSEWCFVLVRPPDAAGLSGDEEIRGFSKLSGMPAEIVERLQRLVLGELVPAAESKDFARFGHALGEFGRTVGEHFAPLQGGIIGDPRMRSLAHHLSTTRGLDGVGQTSWGPTLFVACPNPDAAARLAGEASNRPECSGCEITVAAPLNHGAEICVIH